MSCRTVRGASVLIVSLTDDGLNVPCVLLAREKKARWLNNRNTHIYTDFGGSASDMISKTPEYIAARELVEESAGVLRYFGNETLDHVEHLQDNIEASLLRGEYLAKFETGLNNRQKYVTFVKQVPWQPRISHLFQQTKKLLNRAQTSFDSLTESDKILVQSHPAVKMKNSAVMLDKAFFEKSDLNYFSLAFVQYYLDTGEMHNIDSFKCLSYFKGRLRSATQIVGHLLQEAELLRLPPKFSTPSTTTTKMLSEEKPLSFKPKAKPGVVFVAGTPATGLNFELVKNGIGNSQWRWKPKKRKDNPGGGSTDVVRRRRRSERERDSKRFRNGPLRSITERIGIDNKRRWKLGKDLAGRQSTSDNSDVWSQQRRSKDRCRRSDDGRSDDGQRDNGRHAGRGADRRAGRGADHGRKFFRSDRENADRGKPRNRFFDRHGKSDQQWRRK